MPRWSWSSVPRSVDAVAVELPHDICSDEPQFDVGLLRHLGEEPEGAVLIQPVALHDDADRLTDHLPLRMPVSSVRMTGSSNASVASTGSIHQCFDPGVAQLIDPPTAFGTAQQGRPLEGLAPEVFSAQLREGRENRTPLSDRAMTSLCRGPP